MAVILGISFETPSCKELNKVERIIKDTPLKMFSKGNDYLKLIKDRNNNWLGIYNKFNHEILFLEELDIERKDKILELIK